MKLKPISLIPFKLNNIGDFLNRNHPIYVPETPIYEKHWTAEAKKCIEGMWGHDFNKGVGGYRWMPGNLYFHTNFGLIEQEGDFGQAIKAPPVLRDLDWFIFYGLATCDGFAGFENDTIYTSFAPIRKLERGIDLSHSERILIDKYRDYIMTPKGEFKKYIDPRSYLYSTFNEPLGNAVYLNECQDFMWLASRRTGKSYDINGGIIEYDFTFNGARTLNDYLEENTRAVVVVGSADTTKSDELLDKFKTSYEYLRTSIGAYKSGSYAANGAFWRKTEGTLASTDTLTNQVAIRGGSGTSGPGSQIVHVNFKNKDSAAVGFGARRIVVEEVGLLKNVEGVHYENNATQRRETKYGYTAYIGTGGDIQAVQGVRNMFYNPESYGILPYPDLYKGTGKSIACFTPVYYRFIKFLDENGNTDITKAFEDELKIRDEKKKGTSRKYHGHTLSFPFVPEEIFMQASGGMFHVEQLEKRIIELEEGLFEKTAQVGKLVYTDINNTKCFFEPDLDRKLRPVTRMGEEKEFQNSHGVVPGGLIIFEHPSDNPDVKYLVVYDPVDKGEVTESDSLNAIFVFKFWDILNPKKVQFNIVAEWHGRFDKLDKNHEIAFKLANYYGCTILVETNKRDILRYAEMTKRWNYLEDTPNLALKGKIGTGKYATKGIEIKPGMKPDLETYLFEVCDTITSSSESIDGSSHVSIDIRMVENIPSIRVCEELLHYTRDGNFDSISALFLLGVYVRELTIKPTYNKQIESRKKEYDDFKKVFINKRLETKKPSAFNY